ncbi:hypothetical protein P2318_23120 [Myxococcaceae bacterium GXIMD 01537]
MGALLLGPATSAQSFRSSAPPFKQLPSRDVKVGDAASTAPVGPDPVAFCKEVKSIIRSSGDGFAALRGTKRRNSTDENTNWEARKNLPEFSNCSVFKTESLGEYYFCSQPPAECASLQDGFHTLTGLLMRCLKDWNWEDAKLRSYESRRMVTATSDEGLRLTLELGGSKSSSFKCETTFSIEYI